MRTIREALKRVGVNEDLLKHGIEREVLAMPLAETWREYLCGLVDELEQQRPSAHEIGRAAVARWAIPRSVRVNNWGEWSDKDRLAMFSQLLDESTLPLPLAAPEIHTSNDGEVPLIANNGVSPVPLPVNN
jgi:hypothetical protein